MRPGAELHLVTGKGGTGRTTTALALGLAWAAAGRAVLVVELGADGGLARTAGLAPHHGQVELTRGCAVASLAPETALDRFLESYLPSRRLATLAQRSPVLRALFRAAPGTVEVAQLDALVRATERFDRVVIDGEASAQTLALLETPEVFGDLGARGILGERLAALGRAIRSGALTAHVTTLARPFVVPETKALAAGLAARGVRRGRVLVTGPPPAGVSPALARAAHEALSASAAGEDLAFLAARAEEEAAALHALPGAIDVRGPVPRSRTELAALGARILPLVEAP